MSGSIRIKVPDEGSREEEQGEHHQDQGACGRESSAGIIRVSMRDAGACLKGMQWAYKGSTVQGQVVRATRASQQPQADGLWARLTMALRLHRPTPTGDDGEPRLEADRMDEVHDQHQQDDALQQVA